MTAARWLAPTPLPAVVATVAGLAVPTAEAVAALVRPVLEDARWLDRLVAAFAAEALRDPRFEPPFARVAGPMQAGLLLHADPHVAILATVGGRDRLAAKRARRRSGSIVFTGELTLMRGLGGRAELSLWSGGWRGGALAERCRPAGGAALAPGAVLEVDGRDTAFVVERADADLVLLQAVIAAGAAPTLCEYDSATFDLVATGAAREETSRRQMLATLLAELGHADEAAFDAATRVPEPHARWHAMRAWVACDPDGARDRLAAIAARDLDRERRALATRTLALIGAPCHA